MLAVWSDLQHWQRENAGMCCHSSASAVGFPLHFRQGRYKSDVILCLDIPVPGLTGV